MAFQPVVTCKRSTCTAGGPEQPRSEFRKVVRKACKRFRVAARRGQGLGQIFADRHLSAWPLSSRMRRLKCFVDFFHNRFGFFTEFSNGQGIRETRQERL